MWSNRRYERDLSGPRAIRRRRDWPGANRLNGQFDVRSRGPDRGYERRRYRDRSDYRDGGDPYRDNINDPVKLYNTQPLRRGWKRSSSSSEARLGKRRFLNPKEYSDLKNRWQKNHSAVPLTTVLLARHSEKEDKVPELVFGGFYEHTREAKFGMESHYLRINISQESKNTSETVSIPVPLESIGAVSVIFGMNQFEELLKAKKDRKPLRDSIDRWSKIIEKREGLYKRKMEELSQMPEIEESENEPVEEKQEVEVEAETEETMDATPVENNSSAREVIDLSIGEEQEDEQETATNEQKNQDSEEQAADDLERETERREREDQREERRNLEEIVRKMALSIEKTKTTLKEEQEKLTKIEDNFGPQLALFENDTETTEAYRLFLEDLQQEDLLPIVEKKIDVKKVGADVADKPLKNIEPIVESEEVQTENAEIKEGTKKLQGDTEMAPLLKTTVTCKSCGAESSKNLKFCMECGARQVKDEVQKNEDKFEMITEPPVWVVITLIKPLEKFFATVMETKICNKSILEKASMIVLGYNPEKASSEHLKTLNKVFEGPWRKLRIKPNDKLGVSAYSLEKTLRYLIKIHKKQEISDRTLETCKLCEDTLKRMHMEEHLKEVCLMREVACQYCETILLMKLMKEHHDNDCTRYPILCPRKCGNAKFPRSDVEEHYKICKNTEITCKFNSIGCEEMVKRREVPRHMRDGAVIHVELLKKRLKLMTDYLQTTDNDFKKAFGLAYPLSVERAGETNDGDVKTKMEIDEQQ